MSETPEQLRAKIIAYTEVSPSGCWEWQRGLDRGGYGRIRGGSSRAAHRVAYEVFVGPIPEGLTVDHLCFVARCVNPDHLRLLTLSENAANQRRALRNHCSSGHEYTPENTRRDSLNRRVCRACVRAKSKAYAARKKAQRQAMEEAA